MGGFSCPTNTSPYGIYSQLQMDNTCCPINTKKTNGKCVPTFLFETDQFAARTSRLRKKEVFERISPRRSDFNDRERSNQD
jgi:hypothetical protein